TASNEAAIILIGFIIALVQNESARRRNDRVLDLDVKVIDRQLQSTKRVDRTRVDGDANRPRFALLFVQIGVGIVEPADALNISLIDGELAICGNIRPDTGVSKALSCQRTGARRFDILAGIGEVGGIILTGASEQFSNIR